MELLSRRWTYFLRRRTHRRQMDVRLRPCQKDTTPSHRSSLDRYAATPPTTWTREPRKVGAIYRNGTMIETTSFVIPLDSFRVQSLQEHDMRVIARYGTTAGELTRHISTHYDANPVDLYLTVDGTPLKDSDKVSSDYRQHILLRTRLRGGMRRSSRAPANLDVTKELCSIRQGEPLDHSMTQQDEVRQARVRAGLQQLRTRMWAQHHPLSSVRNGPAPIRDKRNFHISGGSQKSAPLEYRLQYTSLATTRAILPEGLLVHWHGRPMPKSDPRVDTNGRGRSNRDSKGIGTGPSSHIPQGHAKDSERHVSRRVRREVHHQSLGPGGQTARDSLCADSKVTIT